MEPKSRFLTLTWFLVPIYCSMFKSKCYEINLNENSKRLFYKFKKEINQTNLIY